MYTYEITHYFFYILYFPLYIFVDIMIKAKIMHHALLIVFTVSIKLINYCFYFYKL